MHWRFKVMDFFANAEIKISENFVYLVFNLLFYSRFLSFLLESTEKFSKAIRNCLLIFYFFLSFSRWAQMLRVKKWKS